MVHDGRGRDGLVEPGFFLGDNSWGGRLSDQAQNDAIRGLRTQLDTQRHRLNSELRHLRGSLEQRLDRMAASFDAFVELSDVREQLVPFTGAAMARRRVLLMLDGEVPGELRLEASAAEGDYWLLPAAHGLHALLRDDLRGAQRGFSEAAGLDPLRAGVFTLLAAAERAPEAAPALADWILSAVLPEAPGHAASHEWALILLAAEGRLGDGARASVLAGCAELLLDSPEDTPVPSELLEFGKGASEKAKDRRPVPLSALSGVGPVKEALAAADRLADLRRAVEAADAEPSGGGPSPSGDAPSSLALDTARPLLRRLVEEGSPEEAPLLYRAAQLRAVVESGGGASDDVALETWEDDRGRTLDLLPGAAFSPEAGPELRRFALEVFAPVVLREARGRAEAAQAALPDRSSVHVNGVEVAVGTAGADPAGARAAQDRARDAAGDGNDSTHTVGAGVAGAIAAASALFGLVMQQPGLLVLAVVALAAAGGLVLMGKDARKRHGEERAAGAASVDKKLDSAVESWARYRAEAERVQGRAREDARAVERMLGTGR
ncbi:hypothetical protein [Nocardiopsis suaedae]|uniref:Uncharacterized protein n=1 Tax=Nocardiopsis suaedae TaxID=3018444 RepID=A0ABT4TMW5_9ACTN|nr:hypothetical protein [Nocardiopsis suaedae]MDA2806032.1 hypothetical protein [Nocardiopsis suaedae]